MEDKRLREHWNKTIKKELKIKDQEKIRMKIVERTEDRRSGENQNKTKRQNRR